MNGAPRPDRLICTACAREAAIATVPSTCPVCDGILELLIGEQPQPMGEGLWRWHDHLPLVAPAHRVSLGEAGTPLLPAPRLGRELGLADLWIKNESLQPTGSFKDRALALATSLAVEYGRLGVVLSSSGNAGAAAAAYAARAGLRAIVLVPAAAVPAKLKQIRITGAQLVTIDGATHDCCRLASRAADALGFVNVTTTFYCPYGVDAYATIAYELAAIEPDIVLLPVSSGPILAGVMKGFQRLFDQGRIGRLPRPVAIQSAACRPIVEAFDKAMPAVAPPPRPTVAAALNDTLEGYERDGDYTVAILRRYSGTAIAVEDNEILEAVRRIARLEGIAVEPSAAAPVAALPHLLARGSVAPGERIVAVVTGHALKDMPEQVLPALAEPIAPTLDALQRRLRLAANLG